MGAVKHSTVKAVPANGPDKPGDSSGRLTVFCYGRIDEQDHFLDTDSVPVALIS